MGDKTVSVRVRFEGGDQVKAGLVGVGREGARALEQIGSVSKQTGANLQNAGYQVSDFFVQVAGGTAPSRALAQQLPQLLQGFGLIGVAASVLVAALPSLWSLFSSGADDAAALEKELEGVTKAVDAYGSAADLAIEPMDKLIKKYGDMAGAVRQARIEQAELARADAMRSVNDLLSSTGGKDGLAKFSSSQIASVDAQAAAVEQKYARLKQLQDSLTSENARFFNFTQDLAEIDRMNASVGDIRTGVAALAAEYGVSSEQAMGLAVAVERVRDSAGQGTAEQVAAAAALRDYLIEVYGSTDAANEATGGLVEGLNAAVLSAADLAATDMASGIGAAAGAAGQLAGNLSAAVALQYQLATMPGAAVRGLNDERGSQGDQRRSAAEFNSTRILAGFKPAKGGGGSGGGGGGADKDLARAAALTEGVRTETEKYAQALDEVNRLKAKGLITDETYNRQLDKLQDKLGDVGDLGKKAAGAIKGAFAGIFDDPAKALKDLAKQLALMTLFNKILPGIAPGLFGSGGFLGGGIPGFAGGGMHRGGLRIVGENGPELEATGPSMIYPNSALRRVGGGGGGTSVQIINNSGQPARTESSQGPDGRELVRVIVGEEIARGRMDKPMRGRFGSTPNTMIR